MSYLHAAENFKNLKFFNYSNDIANTESQCLFSSGPGHIKSEATYKPIHDRRLEQRESTYNQSESLSKVEHGQSGTKGNLAYGQNETTKGIFAVSEEQEERQLRMKTNCQNLNSSLLQKIVHIYSNAIKIQHIYIINLFCNYSLSFNETTFSFLLQ